VWRRGSLRLVRSKARSEKDSDSEKRRHSWFDKNVVRHFLLNLF
jgi:hypothetical protein